MKEYVVILEQGVDGGWGAYSPEIPRLGVVGYPTQAAAMEAIREALQLYQEEGEPLPEPSHQMITVG